LAYVPRGSTVDRLVWKDRQGTAVPLDLQPRRYEGANLSPDGKRLSATVVDGSKRNVWVGSVDREPLQRLTFGGDDTFGAWTWDSARLAFSSGQAGAYNLFWTLTNGSAKSERLTDSPRAQKPTSWSSGSDVLLFNDIGPKTGLDIWQLSVASKVAKPLVQTPYREMEAVFSPDGKWIAYQSDESGRYEVWARAYPEGPKIQISTDGGSGPMWRGDGHELFYQTATEMMAVPVLDLHNLRVGRPMRLFEHAKGLAPGRGYDVTRDGKRFLLIDAAAGIPSRLHLMLNWSEEVRRAMASAQP
jgi:Tol biopolymer transport system component